MSPDSTAADPVSALDDSENAEVDAEKWQKVAGDVLSRIRDAQKAKKDFDRRGKKITERYRSVPSIGEAVKAGAKFNLFWSNVQTLAPATYSRRPTVQVSRRHRDQDPVGRLAGLILERALQYEIDKGLNFHRTMEAVVLDRLLPGRGVAWVRYAPQFSQETMKSPDPANPMNLIEEQVEVVADEFTPIDYVYWGDYVSSPGRTWADVTWVARQVPFTKEALEKRFGETIKAFGGTIDDVKVNSDPFQPVEDSTAGGRPAVTTDVEKSERRALVWELWDRERKEIVFVSEDCQFPLDIREDVAELEDFFPCPEPLNATTTNDELLPIPDYLIYQEQLNELDTVTNRISLLVEALRVIGVYDSSQTALKDLLQSGLENRLVPVDAWAAFADKGGLKGVMDFVPLDMVIATLSGLYDARERIKQTVYEITGMADIIRGASVASETLGAQQIKAKFANLRLSSRQSQCATFVTGILQIKAQLMCKHYSPKTLIAISAAEQMAEVQKHPERLTAALELLKNEKTRQYRIEVLSGSMVELDEVDEHKRRNEFMSTVSNFFNGLKNIAGVAPEMFPVALEMLKFVVRGFAVGRSLESAIEDASQKIEERLAKPQPPQPDPTKVMEIKADMQLEQMQQAGEDRRAQLESQTKLQVAGLAQAGAAEDREHDTKLTMVKGAQAAGQQQRDFQAKAAEDQRHEQQELAPLEQRLAAIEQVLQQMLSASQGAPRA